jgi:hypothetical protein
MKTMEKKILKAVRGKGHIVFKGITLPSQKQWKSGDNEMVF